MRNISFDNPYLLFVAIPLLLLLLIPYFIAIRKENTSKSTVITLILHTVMIATVAVALAGLHVTTIKTETEIFVVADVSYSTNEQLDKIDSYINELKKEGNIPENSKVGVVCFGKDYKLITPLGAEHLSVKDSGVDTSATDIRSALEYTSGLFSSQAIKRIVLITDGKETVVNDSSNLINAVSSLEAKNIYIDAIYLDSNLKAGEKEVQINSIDYVSSTYLNKEATLQLLIQSNTDYIPDENNPKDKNDAFIRLFDSEGNKKAEISKPLQKGINLITIKLDTSVGGTTNYKVVVEANHDTSPHNNEYTFTQTVNEKLKVLLVSKTKSDLTKAKELYGDTAEIYAPLLLSRKEPVPYSLEELCRYDEFILSDIDVKEIENGTTFLASINTAVSNFGKTLITAGNTYIQNQEDAIYKSLEDMLAIKYGNVDDEPKLYALVIDSSRSMQDASQLIMAKESAIQLLNLMNANDYVMVISFSGEISIAQRPTSALNKSEIIETINNIQPTQGTVIGAALRVAYEQMANQPFYVKHAFLISDGRGYQNDGDNPKSIASQMYRAGIYTSTINTNSTVEGAEKTLTDIKNAGRGEYYFIKEPEDVAQVVSTKIADDVTETKVEKETPVNIEIYNDPIIDGIVSIPNIKGFYQGRVKPNATVVLSVDYEKPSGGIIEVPLYTYWNYGNGKVVSLSTTYSGKWVSNWDGDVNSSQVFARLLDVNSPAERIDYPFRVTFDKQGIVTNVEIIPGEINPDILVELTVTAPNGDVTNSLLYYNSGVYTHSISTTETGKYGVDIKYVFGDSVFEASSSFDICYKPEYNSFEIFDSSVLYSSVGNNGAVSENGELKLENNKDEIETYVFYFTIPLMVAMVGLFVIDIIVRKIKLSDIKSFLKINKPGREV